MPVVASVNDRHGVDDSGLRLLLVAVPTGGQQALSSTPCAGDGKASLVETPEVQLIMIFPAAARAVDLPCHPQHSGGHTIV